MFDSIWRLPLLFRLPFLRCKGWLLSYVEKLHMTALTITLAEYKTSYRDRFFASQAPDIVRGEDILNTLRPLVTTRFYV